MNTQEWAQYGLIVVRERNRALRKECPEEQAGEQAGRSRTLRRRLGMLLITAGQALLGNSGPMATRPSGETTVPSRPPLV